MEFSSDPTIVRLRFCKCPEITSPNVRSKLIVTSANRGTLLQLLIPGIQPKWFLEIPFFKARFGRLIPCRLHGPKKLFEGRFFQRPKKPNKESPFLKIHHFLVPCIILVFFGEGGHSVSSSCCQASVVPTLPDRGIRTLANSPHTIALETCRNRRKNDKGRIHLAPSVRCQY